MKKFKKMTKIILLLGCCVVFLTGCGGEDKFGKLPDEPIAFEQETYVNPADASDEYAAITYKGRTYVPYGTQGSNISRSTVQACIGYLYIEETPDDTNIRIYTLKNDEGENYLMDMDIGGFMEQAVFYRAIDTKGQEIVTPKYIDSLNYDVWK